MSRPTTSISRCSNGWRVGWTGFQGAALIVSHDRAFLDHTVNRILDLDLETHVIHEYNGNYSDYLEQFLATREKQWDEYRDQVAEIRRIKQDIAQTKQQSLQVELTTTSRQPGVRRYAKKVAKKALSREKKLERFLELDEIVEKPKPSWQLKLEFTAPDHQSQDILVTQALSIGYPEHPPLMKNIRYAHPGRPAGGLDRPKWLREDHPVENHRRKIGTCLRIHPAGSVGQIGLHDPGAGTPRPG